MCPYDRPISPPEIFPFTRKRLYGSLKNQRIIYGALHWDKTKVFVETRAERGSQQKLCTTRACKALYLLQISVSFWRYANQISEVFGQVGLIGKTAF